MVGSACWRLLEKEGYCNLIGKSSTELDLRNQEAVEYFFRNEQPNVVIDAAARVGGGGAQGTRDLREQGPGAQEEEHDGGPREAASAARVDSPSASHSLDVESCVRRIGGGGGKGNKRQPDKAANSSLGALATILLPLVSFA